MSLSPIKIAAHLQQNKKLTLPLGEFKVRWTTKKKGGYVIKRTTLFFIFIFLGSLSFAGNMAIMGDAGESGKELNALKNSLELRKITSLIMPGDNLYAGTYSSVWDSWKKSGFKFDVVAIGNHNNGYDREVQYFGMPAEYFSTIQMGARFIVLNSDNKKNVQDQMTWLDRELTSATESLIFLVYHHPTFTVTDSHDWEERPEFQNKMRAILKKHGSKISALIMGHDHITTFLDFGSIPAIIAGSGREVRNASPVSYEDSGFQIQTRYLAPRSQHWAILEIMDGAQQAKVHVVNVSTQAITCSALITGHGNSLTLDKSCNSEK